MRCCARMANDAAPMTSTSSTHVYQLRPRKDHRCVDLISDVLPFGHLWYGDANAVANAIGYAEHYSRSHYAVIRVYDESGSVIETYETRAISTNRKAFRRLTSD